MEIPVLVFKAILFAKQKKAATIIGVKLSRVISFTKINEKNIETVPIKKDSAKIEKSTGNPETRYITVVKVTTPISCDGG